jgi:hypothetical protein
VIRDEMNQFKWVVAIAGSLSLVPAHVEAQADQKVVMTCDYADPSNPYIFVLDLEHKTGNMHPSRRKN